MQAAIAAVIGGRELAADEMVSVMGSIMSGGATGAQIGGFLIALRMKGETVTEIAAAAEVMRKLATPVHVDTKYLVDTCGTGGDGAGTFNVSTAAAFVAAAAGARVAKHGNRSVSSQSGSADVLEAAGVNLDLDAAQVARCITELGVGFMFAPHHHGAMKHAIGPRREMGVRTIFNVLGPLTNPAGAPNQVLGVFSEALVEPLARVLARLGSRHVLVVHAEDGLDEISVGAPTRVAELHQGTVRVYTVAPEEFGVHSVDPASLHAADAATSLARVRSALGGEPGSAADIVALNGGAAIYAAGVAASLGDGVARARAVMGDGSAAARLQALVELSNRLAS